MKLVNYVMYNIFDSSIIYTRQRVGGWLLEEEVFYIRTFGTKRRTDSFEGPSKTVVEKFDTSRGVNIITLDQCRVYVMRMNE